MEKRDIECAARAGHEANRSFCLSMGDASHQSWEDSPEWHKQSCRTQAAYVIRGVNPIEAHELWRSDKEAAGWTFGDRRDPARKTHPALCAFGELPAEQRVKNEMFAAVVHAVASACWRIPQQ